VAGGLVHRYALSGLSALSHGPMLDPSESPRKPSDGILARLKEKGKPQRGQSGVRKAPRWE
jgi:hypothetical protein